MIDRAMMPEMTSRRAFAYSSLSSLAIMVVAKPHPICCGPTLRFTECASENAEYITGTNGTMVVSGQSDESLPVECNLSPACGPPGSA